MGIIRQNTSRNERTDPPATDDFIQISCPKCQKPISVKAIGAAAIRCGACDYPLIKGSDLAVLIQACEQVRSDSAPQVNTAARILSRLAESIPDAAIALNNLAARMPFTGVSESERFGGLINAYAAGDSRAQEMLNNICLSNPQAYEMRVCKSCGARKYIYKKANTNTVCIYCQSPD